MLRHAINLKNFVGEVRNEYTDIFLEICEKILIIYIWFSCIMFVFLYLCR